MVLDPNEKKSNAVRRGLILLLLGLQLVTVFLILFISYFSSERDIDIQISGLLKDAMSESKEHTKAFLEPSYRAVQTAANLFSKNVIDIEKQNQIEEYFLSQLAINKEITGIYFATSKGDFSFVSRVQQEEGVGYMTKVIQGDKPGKASFYFRNEDLVLSDTKEGQDDEYSPFERPWYRKAVDNKDLIWTDPYIFYTSSKPGITVSSPVFNKEKEIVGVVGIDIELTSMSRFLADLKVYGKVLVSMVSSTGKFVATPSLSEDNLQINDLDINTSEDNFTLEKMAVNQYLKRSGHESKISSSEFNFANENYAIRFEPLILESGPEWIISAYAPKSSFLTNIRSGESRNVIVALCVLLLSLIIGWFLIRKTWQPFDHFFHDVVTDQLTGLFNRRFLENIGSRMYIRLLRQQHEYISLALIDLDFFSKTNDEYGEAIGSKVLIAFSEFLKQTLRPEDIITRYSGDTFVIIFPGLTNDNAVSVVDRMRKQLDSWPLAIDDLLIGLSFSAGVETIDQNNCAEDTAFTDFIEQARLAMKEAKSQGRDRVLATQAKKANEVESA